MADVMEWDDLPTVRGRVNEDYDAVIEFLSQEPGKWGRLKGGFSASSKAGGVSQSLKKYATRQDVNLDTTTRTTRAADGVAVVHVWARIVPESETESDSAE